MKNQQTLSHPLLPLQGSQEAVWHKPSAAPHFAEQLGVLFNFLDEQKPLKSYPATPKVIVKMKAEIRNISGD